MKLQTFSFEKKKGWSVPFFPELDSEKTLVFVFFAPVFAENPDPIAELSKAFPRAHFLGCSTVGELHGAEVKDDTIVVAVARFERTRLISAYTSISQPARSSGPSMEAGKALGAELGRSELKGIFAFADGVTALGADFIRGIGLMLNRTVSIAGGLAGDGGKFERSWVLDKNRVPATGVASAVGFCGPYVSFSQKAALGWEELGLARQVTRAKANVLFELEKKPALTILRDYLTDEKNPVSPSNCAFPLSFTPKAGEGERVIRTVLPQDATTVGLVLSGDFPADSISQFLKSTPESLIQGAREAASALRGAIKNEGSALCLSIGSSARRQVLGPYADEEAAAIAQGTSLEAGAVGFYGYGELATSQAGGPELKNGTMTLTILTETI